MQRKGGDLLLNIAKREEFKNCEFHFLSYEKIQERSDNVIVHTNIAPNTEALRELYRNADIFVLPSRGDIQPIAILEAMSMGLPVISTRVGAIHLAVDDGRTGFVVPPNDEEALVDKLRLLLKNPEMRLLFGLNARRVVEATYNLERNSEIILEHLIKAANMHTRHQARSYRY
jgi:glycosyltransferase involved in cell wall biosynthesis